MISRFAAKVTIKNADGQTPMHIAVTRAGTKYLGSVYNFREVVELMIGQGAGFCSRGYG